MAQAEGTPIEAIDIKRANDVFWGVQYDPEIPLNEVADALRRPPDDLNEEGLFKVTTASTHIPPYLKRCTSTPIVVIYAHLKLLLQKMPQCRLQTIERCGHTPHPEWPEDYVEAMKAFLKQTLKV